MFGVSVFHYSNYYRLTLNLLDALAFLETGLFIVLSQSMMSELFNWIILSAAYYAQSLKLKAAL